AMERRQRALRSHLEHCAPVCRSSRVRGPVIVAIRGLNQSGNGVIAAARVEVRNFSERPLWRDLEENSAPVVAAVICCASISSPVEVPILSECQPIGGVTGSIVKRMQNAERSCSTNLEHGAWA